MVPVHDFCDFGKGQAGQFAGQIHRDVSSKGYGLRPLAVQELRSGQVICLCHFRKDRGAKGHAGAHDQ